MPNDMLLNIQIVLEKPKFTIVLTSIRHCFCGLETLRLFRLRSLDYQATSILLNLPRNRLCELCLSLLHFVRQHGDPQWFVCAPNLKQNFIFYSFVMVSGKTRDQFDHYFVTKDLRCSFCDIV